MDFWIGSRLVLGICIVLGSGLKLYVWYNYNSIHFHHLMTFQVTDNEEFIELIKEDAASVENREEVDSIAIIDDLRYHIANNLKMYSELQEAQEKLSYLDHLLQELGIEG